MLVQPKQNATAVKRFAVLANYTRHPLFIALGVNSRHILWLAKTAKTLRCRSVLFWPKQTALKHWPSSVDAGFIDVGCSLSVHDVPSVTSIRERPPCCSVQHPVGGRRSCTDVTLNTFNAASVVTCRFQVSTVRMGILRAACVVWLVNLMLTPNFDDF